MFWVRLAKGKERGQAHLPKPEINDPERLMIELEAFDLRFAEPLENLKVRRGLPPRLARVDSPSHAVIMAFCVLAAKMCYSQ